MECLCGGKFIVFDTSNACADILDLPSSHKCSVLRNHDMYTMVVSGMNTAQTLKGHANMYRSLSQASHHA